MRSRVLIIDDEHNFREFLSEALEAEGYDVSLAGTARAGLALAERDPPEIVLLDQNLPDGNGLDLLARLRTLPAEPVVIVITAYAAYSKAVEAVKAGAHHYLAKPFEFSELLGILSAAGAADRPSPHGDDPPALRAIVGESPRMRELKEEVLRIARRPVMTVLVRGESGTGKELVARAIHALSDRAERRFLAVNCAALADTLLMNELFGHERGAYTDAREQKEGVFEAANGGTLLLDEIGELAPHSQAALLRVLEHRTIMRVGGTREIPVDVRVIAATNCDLQERIAQGQFRADLYYRLSAVELEVPPLRERGDDVLLLAEHFARTLARRYGTPARPLSASALEAIRRYHWPGNVRELKNAIERAYAIGTGTEIVAEDLPAEVWAGGRRASAPRWDGARMPPFRDAKQRAMDEFENRYLREALRRTGGNVTRAAEEAELLRQVFQRLLRRHGIDPEDYRAS